MSKSHAHMNNTQISHFFLGVVTDRSAFERFLEEHYAEDDDDEDDERPISAFYGSQGEWFCDHDFMETGWRENERTLEEFFQPYSYSEQWSDAVCNAARARNLEHANALIFIAKSEIESPQSVSGDGFELTYVGEFEYRI